MKSNWEIRPLGELVKFSSGGTPSKKNPDYWNGAIPWISAKTMKDERVSTSDLMITEEGLASCSKLAPIGSLLLLTRGSGLFNGIPLCIVEKPVAFNQDVKCIESCADVSNKFIFYWLKSQEEYLRAKLEVTGIGAGKFDTKFLQELNVPIPCKEERDRIVSIAESISKKIIINTKINDNLYEMVNAYYALLFKDVECEMTTIGSYAERIYSGGTPTTSNAAYWDGEFGWFSSGETRNRFVISTEKSITQAGVDNSSTKLASKYDIVMASAGQGFTRGQTSMLLIDTYVNQSVIVIHAERKVLPYLFWNLANRYEELRAISDSSSIRGSLTTKMIAAFEIPLANEEALQAFADFSWSVIPQIENNLLENVRLAAMQDSLLPKLMSGAIDVSDIKI